jgi:hypothetical protein
LVKSLQFSSHRPRLLGKALDIKAISLLEPLRRKAAGEVALGRLDSLPFVIRKMPGSGRRLFLLPFRWATRSPTDAKQKNSFAGRKKGMRTKL